MTSFSKLLDQSESLTLIPSKKGRNKREQVDFELTLSKNKSQKFANFLEKLANDENDFYFYNELIQLSDNTGGEDVLAAKKVTLSDFSGNTLSGTFKLSNFDQNKSEKLLSQEWIGDLGGIDDDGIINSGFSGLSSNFFTLATELTSLTKFTKVNFINNTSGTLTILPAYSTTEYDWTSVLGSLATVGVLAACTKLTGICASLLVTSTQNLIDNTVKTLSAGKVKITPADTHITLKPGESHREFGQVNGNWFKSKVKDVNAMVWFQPNNNDKSAGVKLGMWGFDNPASGRFKQYFSKAEVADNETYETVWSLYESDIKGENLERTQDINDTGFIEVTTRAFGNRKDSDMEKTYKSWDLVFSETIPYDQIQIIESL